MKDPHIHLKLLIQIKPTSCCNPRGFYFSCFCLLAHSNEERRFFFSFQDKSFNWLVQLHGTQKTSTFQWHRQKSGKNAQSLHWHRKRVRSCAWLLPPCWEPSMPGCLQHPWRWIAAASSCPLSSPENNEANNFFNYLSRAASSVNKFVWLSPAGLAFYFVGLFHIHLKHVLLPLLLSAENFLSFPTFLFYFFIYFYFFV